MPRFDDQQADLMRTIMSFAIAALAIVNCQAAIAARVITVNIKVEDKLVYTAYYGDDGYPPAAEVWKYLGDPPYHIKKETVRIQPTKAELKGEVTILIKNVPNTATVKNLKLVRDDKEEDLWYLPPEEVARTAEAAGYKVAEEDK